MNDVWQTGKEAYNLNRGQKILIGVLGVLMLTLGVVILLRVWGMPPASATVAQAKIPRGEYDPAVWGKAYPLQYASYEKNKEMKASPTGYGGSLPVQKWDMQPEIKVNFDGMAFSKDYKEDRGHSYALLDQKESARVTKATVGSCIVCKTPYVEKLFAEQGWGFTKTPLVQLLDEAKHPVSCASCHDSETMALKITQPAFVEAMQHKGIDVTKASRQDMRSYVCAQCHSEYYFEPGSNRVVFPWDNGLTPEAMYTYYSTKPNGFEKDWVHARSKAPMLKAQHPDYEEWSGGVHAQSGVSCADCHMPYMRQDGQKYTSHHVTSPLQNVRSSCLTCHKQDEAWAVAQVKMIQDSVFAMQQRAGQNVARAHDAIAKAAATPGVQEAQLAEARELIRQAQWHWDYVAAANGMGFHNPVQSQHSLGTALDLSYKAIEKANQAIGQGGL